MKKDYFNKPLSIAMIGHKRIPGREGGIEVVVEELAVRMAVNNKVTVYNRKKRGIEEIKSYKGVNVVNVPTIQTKKLEALSASFFASIHAVFCRYDVIHYHGIGPSLMLIIPHLFHKKVVVTVHGLNYKTPKWKGLGEKVMKLGERVTAKYADQIITLSKEQQKYFMDTYHRETIYIPNGVTLKVPLRANLITDQWGLKPNNYILFVSRVVPGKGIEILIDAYKKIDTQMPLIIAGDSQYVNEFRDKMIAIASDDKRIQFVGFVSGDILTELYSNTFLFVFPSEAEGMPMALLEALSFNVHCLVSDISENVEIGKDYVKTFHVKDKNDLYEKLKECIEGDTGFRNDSRTYVEKNFNWDSVVNRTLEVYKNV